MKTLQDIESINRSMLSVMDVCGYLECDPHVLRATVREDKKNHTDSLGYPASIIGNRVKFPKEAFVQFHRGKETT